MTPDENVPPGFRKIGLHACRDGERGWVIAPTTNPDSGHCSRCGAKVEAIDLQRETVIERGIIDFGLALDLAMEGMTTPLAKYLERHPLTEEERLLVAGCLRSFDRPRRGRPRIEWWRIGPESRPEVKHTIIQQAQRVAAYLTLQWQKRWRVEHGAERIPRGETDKAMMAIIEEIARRSRDFPPFRIDASDINELAVLDLMKTGRVKA